MRVTIIFAVCLAAIGGCAPVKPAPPELARAQSAVTFRFEQEAPDMAGFVKHWDLAGQSAWYNASTGDVLVLGRADGGAMRIAGFPAEYGRVAATGWEDGKRFFVHLSPGADSGTMIYCDLDKRQVVEVKPWAAW